MAGEGYSFLYGVYGFLACAGLILMAKGWRILVQRGKDYYDR